VGQGMSNARRHASKHGPFIRTRSFVLFQQHKISRLALPVPPRGMERPQGWTRRALFVCVFRGLVVKPLAPGEVSRTVEGRTGTPLTSADCLARVRATGARLRSGSRYIGRDGGVLLAAEIHSESRSWGWLFPALWCGLILLASSIPDIAIPRAVFARDKVIHFTEYAVLGALVAAAFSEWLPRSAPVRAVFAIVVCVAFGALDEVYQINVSGRYSDYLDFLSDCAGALAGQTFILVRRRRGEGT
jgi:VanZ family protein